MTPRSELEIQGNLFTHPFPELLAEIAEARLNGSLRVSARETKCVIYFKHGRVVFAVSNARSTRLFDIMLRRGKITKEDLVQIPNFSNDFEFSAYLEQKNQLTKSESSRLFAEQIEGILVDILAWDTGEWTFSSLARIRDGLSFEVGTTQLIVDFGRCMAVDKMLSRFRSLDERFSRSEITQVGRDLTPDEAYILSQANDSPQTPSGLIGNSTMTDQAALHAIYTLWLGGLLIRNDWQPAFSQASIAAMKGAKLELRTEAKPLDITAATAAETTPDPIPAIAERETAPEISLEEYLTRVENADTFYDILGVDSKAENDVLKRAYFSLAKNFHPDRYHSEGGEKLKQIQSAFTQLAQAHETLKNTESRDLYDYRMRKELEEREKRRSTGEAGDAGVRIQQAAENFEQGFNMLMDNEIDEALPFLARAVHFAPKNARYRAYYGKALSADEKQRHKAEAEIQAALKIDPNNPTFRILLAEFYIQFNVLKRAEGELTRLLAMFPSNREARELLDRIKG